MKVENSNSFIASMSLSESMPARVNDYFSRLEVDDEDGNEFTDRWNNGELLCLASAVQRSGDKNWVSVSRSIKPFGDPKRPSDWYTPKNCALQYSKLLKGVEDFKKKSLPRTERETSEELLVKNLTDKRLTELNWLNQQTKNVANSLKVHLEMIENGEFDDNLDELLKLIEEQEKQDEEDYKEWISKRENLNATKKLNKCRVPLSKGKTPSRGIEGKRKNSPNPDQSDDSSLPIPISEIKIEVDTDNEFLLSSQSINSQEDDKSSISALLEGSKTANVISPHPVSSTPTSPLLTSLLRSVASSNASSPIVSYVTSPVKESEASATSDARHQLELDISALIAKSQETPPRSVQQSPRNTPDSSPLLNSLLKNSGSSPLSSIQLSQAKEASTPKPVTSPQSFFSPSALATAAAQQMAFFSQPELGKTPIPSSPATSACLSAPTLSKLLEMPPSTPGRLPPLPIVETTTATATVTTVSVSDAFSTQSPQKSSAAQLLNELELQLTPSPTKKSPEKSASEPVVESPKKPVTVFSPIDKKPAIPTESIETTKPLAETKQSFKRPGEMADTSQKNIDLLEEVCESFELNQAFEMKEVKQEPSNNACGQDKSKNATDDIETAEQSISEFMNSSVNIEKLVSSSDLDLVNKIMSSESILGELESNLSEDDKSKRTDLDSESLSNLLSESMEESMDVDDKDSKPVRSSDVKSPPAKKPRLFEKVAAKEIKKELSEDETPPVAKRPGRKAKKGRKFGRATPMKQDEPKDQYEFSESTEENSVGYQTSNTLCYMPRVKEETIVESKPKQQSQAPEETSVTIPEKKLATPTRGKQMRSQPISRKGLFTSDEEKMSDAITSDDASNSHLGDEKLKKWTDLNEKKEDISKDTSDNSKIAQKVSKPTDPVKKKLNPKRNLFNTKTDSQKEKKSLSSDLEESSACSRDSEDASSSAAWQKDDGDTNEASNAPANVEAEANDSHISSSVAAESDKQIDEVEGYDSLQGSITTDFSPPPQSEIKEEKEPFNKQDWFQGVSPKSSEPVSQSSEESEEDESDNWDNQSVSTNKSASHSASQPARSKRKERESPQYKAWKKAISIVLREASCHKYANVFLQKVTNDVAPGYLNIVNRPMDLSLLKKNVDNGVVKTTNEVHRDMLLMFQNAVMYNSSDHDVHHMAVEMQRDVIQQIQAFLTTQFNDKDETSDPTSSLRGARSAKSQKNYTGSKPKEDTHGKE